MYAVLLALALSELPSRPEALNGIQTRLNSMSNIMVEYDFSANVMTDSMIIAHIETSNHLERADATEVVSALKESVTQGLILHERKGKGSFRFRDGASRFDQNQLPVSREVSTFLSGRNEWLFQIKGSINSGAVGAIKEPKSGELPTESIIDYAIGLRLVRDRSWLNANRLKRAKIGPADNKALLKVRVEDESSYSILHEWIVDPARSYRIVEYRVLMCKPDFAKDVAEFAVIKLQNMAFITVDGVSLPQEIVWTRLFRAHVVESYEPVQFTLNVNRYRLSDKSNTETSMCVTWPVGTRLTDERTQKAIEVVDVPRAFGDAELEKIAREN